jgi:hypothetical protein
VFELLSSPVRLLFIALLIFCTAFEPGQSQGLEKHCSRENNAKRNSVDSHILDQLNYTAVTDATIFNFFLQPDEAFIFFSNKSVFILRKGTLFKLFFYKTMTTHMFFSLIEYFDAFFLIFSFR